MFSCVHDSVSNVCIAMCRKYTCHVVRGVVPILVNRGQRGASSSFLPCCSEVGKKREGTVQPLGIISQLSIRGADGNGCHTEECICAVDLITAIDMGVKWHFIDHFEVASIPLHWEIRAQGLWQKSVRGDEGSASSSRTLLQGEKRTETSGWCLESCQLLLVPHMLLPNGVFLIRFYMTCCLTTLRCKSVKTQSS